MYRLVLIGSIALFLAAILFVGLLLLPSLATAQLQQQQQMTTTTPPASPSSVTSPATTTPPLTPEEQEQQNRLQSTIAATTRDLNETEKEVSGVVFTPRWSDVVWVNANSLSVLVAYCFPGEFADSGQEVLGGFGLEVLESYAVDLPQGFMAWMAVVGNEDVQNRRLPAALGVICASDLNQADSRILSPQEQQEVNNINQQFTSIQNTQITNIDQVINIINDVTTNGTTTTGPVTTPPPSNQTGGNNTGGGGLTKQELIVQIIPNATRGFVGASFQLKSDVINGTAPYSYEWGPLQEAQASHPCSDQFGKPSYSCIVYTPNQGGTHQLSLTVKDSQGKTGSDSILISVRRLPLGEGGGALDNPTVQGEGFRAEIIANATQAYTGAAIKFDASITGGVPPYSYTWSVPNVGAIDQDRSITQMFFEPGTSTYILTARDSNGNTASDTVQIIIRERLPRGGLLGEGILDNATVAGEGLGGETSSREGGGITTEELGIPPPPPTVSEGGGAEEGVPPSATEEGEEEPSTPPSSDDTGGEEGGESSTDEEGPTTLQDGG
ncbi:MAG: hypothetical protein M3243_01085 [Thermoproteota archaeon]|nr:hypothetical protein [Thermoproteota archaeon]